MESPKPREVKVVLIGNTGVGKSSIVRRFVTHNFLESETPTLAVEFVNKVVAIGDKQIKFQIWDTAGQEKFRSLAPMYYRGVGAAILVYDITSESSFTSLKRWVADLRNHVADNIAMAIAGNKCDLNDSRVVQRESAESYSKEIGAFYIETSAKEGYEIETLFNRIGSRLPAPPPPSDPTLRLSQSDFNKPNSSTRKSSSGWSSC